MKDSSNANQTPPREPRPPDGPPPQGNGQSFQAAAPRFNGHARPGRFDLWTALDLFANRWHWLVMGTFISAGCFYLLGWYMLKPKYVANAQLRRYELPGKSDSLKNPPISGETLAALIRAPELLRRTGAEIVPNVPPEILTKLIKIDPDPDSDMVTVQLAARDPRVAVELLNLYLTNAVAYTKDLEASEAAIIANDHLKQEVTEMDQDIKELQDQFRKMPTAALVTNSLAQIGEKVGAVGTNLANAPRTSMLSFAQQAERLQKALTELDDLKLKYTDIHPLVQRQQSVVDELRQEAAQSSTNHNASGMSWGSLGTGAGALDPELDIIHIKLRALEDGRIDLQKRQREAELYASNPRGSLLIHAPANLKTVKASMRSLKISLVTIFGALVGLGASIALVLLVEFVDNRLKTTDDIVRVAHLPVVAVLGNLGEMSPPDRSQWAFRTWTSLQGRLSPSPNYGLICGVTSSAPGEGRSTWISLLAEAASLAGFRVLTIATRPSPTHVDSTDETAEEALLEDGEPNGVTQSAHALTTSVLSAPAQVTEQLTGPNSQPVVHIPLPGWVWNLERRKQWREALNHWSQVENLVIFVELPPASVPEAVLLGSNLPNLLWLTQSGTADAGKTRAQLETLRHARCNLVGALLNRQPTVPIKQRFPRWVNGIALFATLSTAALRAQDTNPPTPVTPTASAPTGIAEPTAPAPAAEAQPNAQTNLSFSIVRPSQRAAWQQHLTLGPGDVLTLNLYGQPELTRTEVPVGPDGRVGFLEAQDVLATGLTIDELRAKLDQELGKYRRAPHTMITPVAFKSKKYFMLGKVTTKGVFILDRPLTVLEALARAHGLESALVDRNIVTMTDFQRSFLARGGKRIPLNFENLFQRGDLSQNIAVEPGDYIYFAPGDVQEVYVVGEIRVPGPVAYYSGMTIIGAIAGRGGFTERAFRARVLVIRGSLSNPERIAVNTHAILDAKEPNFALRPKDIIFVNSRPFIRVEELADLAATAFIQSVIASWVGVDVVKPF